MAKSDYEKTSKKSTEIQARGDTRQGSKSVEEAFTQPGFISVGSASTNSNNHGSKTSNNINASEKSMYRLFFALFSRIKYIAIYITHCIMDHKSSKDDSKYRRGCVHVV